jgi:hypothetical protein
MVNWPPDTEIVVPTVSAACRSPSHPAAPLGVPSSRTDVSGNGSARRRSTPESSAKRLSAVPSHASRPAAGRYSSQYSTPAASVSRRARTPLRPETGANATVVVPP